MMDINVEFEKGFEFYYILFTFIANMHRFFSLKDKKGIAITNTFQKIWLGKGNEFNKRSIKPFFFFQNNDIEMYSTHNEKKSVIGERFFKTLKIKFISG